MAGIKLFAIPARNVFATLILFAGIFVSLDAFAQCDDSHPRYGESIAVSEKAAEKFLNGDYESAGEGFKKAYAICPEPTYVKNQMIAYFKGNQCSEALNAADTLKATAPNQDVPLADRDDWRKVNMRCRVILAQDAIDQKQYDNAEKLLNESYQFGPKSGDLAQIKTMEDQVRAAKSGTVGQKQEPDPDPEPQPESGKSNTLAYVGWATTGVGLALTAVTAFLYVTGPLADINDILDDSCGGSIEGCNADNGYDTDAEQAWNTAADDAQALVPLWVAGGVISAAGIGILIYHYAIASDETDTAGAMLVPQVSSDSVGAALHWTW